MLRRARLREALKAVALQPTRPMNCVPLVPVLYLAHIPAIACRSMSRIHEPSADYQGPLYQHGYSGQPATFRNRQALWPSGRVTALRTWYTSRHQDDASKDLQPCFIHARQKRSVRRYLAAVVRSGRRLLHLVFIKRSEVPQAPAVCMSPWCMSTIRRILEEGKTLVSRMIL